MALIRPLATVKGKYPRFIVWCQSTNNFVVDLDTFEKATASGTNNVTLNGVSLNRSTSTLTTTFNCHIRQYESLGTLETVNANTPKSVTNVDPATVFVLIYPDE